MTDLGTLWKNSLDTIKESISNANFNTWFKNTTITRQDGGVIYLGVPNEFVKEWLVTKYHKTILETLRDQNTAIRGVEYTVLKRHGRGSVGQIMQSQPTIITNELPLQDLYVNKKDNLNPRYDFTNFIIGPFNELAYSAARAIITKPATYNPLFIYGPTGLGKTHLIQACGNELKKLYPNTKVYYTSSETFTMDYVNALRSNKINNFKDKYRQFDALIMDDIQFLSGKEKTQEELFHLFNILYDQNKQIIFSSDKHPSYIVGLEDRLRSRFAAGMIVDVSKPEFESRVAIIKAKAAQQNFIIDNESVEFISKNVEGNIREIEGVINSMICQTRLRGRTLGLREIKNLVKSNIKPKKNVSVQEIVKIIADYYNLEEETIYAKTRRKEIVRSRQVTMYLLREDFNISYPLIGRKLGGRDHTTVIHSYLKIKKELDTNPELTQEIEQLRAMLAT